MTTAVRVVISPPAPDESFSSVVDRAAEFWAASREVMLRCLAPSDPDADLATDMDMPSAELLDSVAYAIGCSSARLSESVIGDCDLNVAGGHRVGCCPLCWNDDRHSGREPYFRRAWSALNAIHCRFHKVPLCPWPRTSFGRRYPPLPPSSNEYSDGSWRRMLEYAKSWANLAEYDGLRLVLAATTEFADKAVDVLRGAEFPSAWRGDAKSLRELLVLLSTNPAPFAERVPLDRLIPKVPDRRLFGGSVHTTAPDSSGGWEAVQRLGSPVVRRTLWWLAGRTIVPDWNPLPTHGWEGVCSKAAAWWHRRVVASVSPHAQADIDRIGASLGMQIPEPLADLLKELEV